MATARSSRSRTPERVSGLSVRLGNTGASGPELVRRLMRELGLVACQPRPWRPSTTRQGEAGPIPDLVNRDFSAAAPGEKMVGDITYSAQLPVMCSSAGGARSPG